ncbi:MAG: hypothetical protein H5T86_04090 [Armatimonadetes bacterium]|nr:hypothetical protein [Armatimonadota bacterium]
MHAAMVISLAAAAAVVAWVPREHLNLSDQWEMAVTPGGQKVPPQDGWRPATVPATFSSVRGNEGWFRRKFAAPREWTGRRVKLVLQGAKYRPEVFINGTLCGQHFGGYEPATFDITSAVRVGEENELLVHVYDWTSLFKGPPLEIPPDLDWESLRGAPRDRIVYPIGGRYEQCGLWDDVIAYAVPGVYIADAFVMTDVGQRRLTVEYYIVNETAQPADATLRPRVEINGRTALTLESKTVRVPPAGNVRVTVSVTWKDGQVELWSPETPRLYVLVTELQSPSGTDVRRDRFGFRQLKVNGPDFYLNRTKRHLLATSAWPMAAQTHAEIAEVLKAFKGANCICFRTHTQPWRQIWYDVADEVGILMIPEGAVWNDDEVYRLDDPEFWRNWGEHLRGMVHALRNHPSIIMWSLENEFHGSRARSGSVYEKRLADLGRLVKREDPTRPITYESDGDPDGVADVIGLHYPHEPPWRRLWPQDAYWMDEVGTQGVGMFWPTPEFRWDRRKPLYIGEFGWWPAGDPGGYSLISGDDGYRDLNWARGNAKAAVWRWQTIAYRHYGISGICPWTLVEGGPLDMDKNLLMAAQAYAMQHVAAYIREELRRAYGGSTVVRHLEIFNDSPRRLKATLRWALSAEQQVLAQGGMGLDIAPGDHLDRTVEFAAPSVKEPIAAVLRVSIEANGARIFVDERPLTIYPSPRLKAPAGPLYAYDPAGRTLRLLREQRLTVRELADLSRLPQAPAIVIIGEHAFGKDTKQTEAYLAAQRLAEFVRRGGAVIVLQQTEDSAAVLPGGLAPGSRSTIGFVLNPVHPLMAGLPDDAFKFWAPDHTISSAEMPRLGRGAVALVAVGTADGLSRCVLAEARRGPGTWLRCQLPVVERFSDEPMACELLQRLLNYAAEFVGASGEKAARPLVLVGGDARYRDALRDVGVRWEEGDDVAGALGSGRMVLVRGDAPIGGSPAELAAAIAEGGTLLLDRPGEAMVKMVGEAVGLELSLEGHAGPALRSEGRSDLVQQIAREDLYWLGPQPRGPSWANQPLASDVASGCIAIGASRSFNPMAQAGPGEMELSGAIVRREADQVIMATVGSAQAKFVVPAEGVYAIAVEARGTKCQGVYAMALVLLDGEAVGAISTTDQWHRRLLPVRMTAGEHTVAVRFINDMNTPTEDRNLFLRSIALCPADERLERIEEIAMGMTCLSIPMGKGRAILNFLKWDDPGTRNTEKGVRFWSSLLAALGADFSDGIALTYSVSQFTPDPDMPHYSAQGNVASIAASGGVEGDIEVPQDADYEIIVEASGTRAAGILPIVAVSVDGKKVADVQLTDESWRRYPVRLSLGAGRHRIRLQFTNDYYQPPEDRNLRLRRLLIRPAPE